MWGLSCRAGILLQAYSPLTPLTNKKVSSTVTCYRTLMCCRPDLRVMLQSWRHKLSDVQDHILEGLPLECLGLDYHGSVLQHFPAACTRLHMAFNLLKLLRLVTF